MERRDSPDKPNPPDREVRLAQALRANLRRRKLGNEAKPKEGPKIAD